MLALLFVLHVHKSEGWKEKERISPGGNFFRPKALYFRSIPIGLPIVLHPKPSPFCFPNKLFKWQDEVTLGEAKTMMADELWILANMGWCFYAQLFNNCSEWYKRYKYKVKCWKVENNCYLRWLNQLKKIWSFGALRAPYSNYLISLLIN